MFQNKCDSFKNASVLDQNDHVREKISKVLEMQAFEINQKSLEFMRTYWYEDIQLIEKLMKTDQMRLAEILDGTKTCIDIALNPGVEIGKGSLCGAQGFCKVTLDHKLLFPPYLNYYYLF